MTQGNDKKVLSDLSRIVSRYGPEPFMRLAELIRDPQRADELATVLETVAARSNQGEQPTKSRKGGDVGKTVLDGLKEPDPQKHTAIADFRERLMAGTILRSMNEIRHFAEVHDFEIGNAKSRKSAIPSLLRSIAQWETSAIVALLDSIPEAESDDRSLERWRELIVKPRTQVEAVSSEDPSAY